LSRNPTEPLLLFLERVPSPLGRMLIATDAESRVRVLDWEEHEANMLRLLRLHYPRRHTELIPARSTSIATRAMQAYFEGELLAVGSLEIATGGTVFQRRVWDALRTIPPGQTLSYRGLAERIGQPEATRAVGMANGANPISVIVPCHRVIGSNASLIGYGGGLSRKQWLLAHERAQASPGKQGDTLPLPGF
jgi:O-6-methylguanine DNA methyltransferase